MLYTYNVYPCTYSDHFVRVKSILEKTEDVQPNLKGATDAQPATQASITQADKAIGDAEQDLTQVTPICHLLLFIYLFVNSFAIKQ